MKITDGLKRRSEEILGMPLNTSLAVNQFFLCKDFTDEVLCFSKYYEELKDCKFIIYSDVEGNKFPYILKNSLVSDFAIIEMGFSERYYFFDLNVYQNAIRGKQAQYLLDFCVELDTQVVSYLKNIFKNWDKIDIPIEKQKLFYYLTREDVNFSDLPYLVENAKKINPDNFQEIYLNLRSYEMFKNFNYKEYIDSGKIIYKKDISDMIINVDRMFAWIRSEDFSQMMQKNFELQEYMYCLLMKAISIEISYSKKSTLNKMKMLIEFVNNSLGFVSERELVICYYYFNHDNRTINFFKKVKGNSKNILNNIKGMAWDLAHIRMLERLYNYIPYSKAEFGIHPILTYDNGLKDILSINPIKKVLIYNDAVFPCFKFRLNEIMPESTELLFSDNIISQRINVLKSRNMRKIINELEKDFIPSPH